MALGLMQVFADLDVVMATCNGQALIAEQLVSIFRQTLLPRRVLIQDDASDDQTMAVLERLRVQAPAGMEVIIRRNLQRLGVKQNFNQALLLLQKLGAHAWIMLADQDDIWLPRKIELALSSLGETGPHDQPCLGFSDLILADAAGQPTPHTLFQRLRLDPSRRRLADLFVCNVFTGCTMAFNRACLDLALPIPDQARLHDCWIGLVAAGLGRVVLLPEASVLYRQHDRNVLGAANGDRVSGRDLLAQLRQGRVAELYVNPNLEQACAYVERYGAVDQALLRRFPPKLLRQLKHASPWRRVWAAAQLRWRHQGWRRQWVLWLFLAWPRRRRLSSQAAGFTPYRLRLPVSIRPHRERVLHVIANVQTGGSTRLVADLIEQLSDTYCQRVLTSFAPVPAEYEGMDVVELRQGSNLSSFVEHLKAVDPKLVHVHYWGGCDRRWYRRVFQAAESLGLPVVQNVNTPVSPYRSAAITANVYVSDYLRMAYGAQDPLAHVIYPGSDFSLFRQASEPASTPTVGMVYRLEPDKLDPRAIDVFVAIARARPDVRCLIVGGGSLLEPMLARVSAESLQAQFEFTDYIAYTELPRYYARMSVFVAPVRYESFGQVTPFAMSMGLPVVAFDVGALPEQLQRNAVLAPAGDVKALAALACRLLDAPGECRSIGAANRERAHELYSVRSMVAAYRSLYEQETARRQ